MAIGNAVSVHISGMTTKLRKPLRYITPIFALSLLSGYVVYSQLQHTRTVISSSKSLQMPSQTVAVTEGGTNQRMVSVEELKARLLTNHSKVGLANPTSTVPSDFDMVASSSKSAPVFPRPEEWTKGLKARQQQKQEQVATAPVGRTNTVQTLKP